MSLAVFVATIPLLWVFRMLTGLPRPLILSYRRWPKWTNVSLIGLITANVAVFIRGVYAGSPEEPIAFMLRFVIAVLVYFFGFVLLIRQFAGLYPEYFVTTGRTGLTIRKALYRNVLDVDERDAPGGETELGVHMRTGGHLHLVLPTRHVEVFRRMLRESQPPD